MNKPKGGRCKKAEYKTQVVRIPEPLLNQVTTLINNFHGISFESQKPVTSKKVVATWQVSIDDAIEFFSFRYPNDKVVKEDYAINDWSFSCSSKRKNHNKEWDDLWEEVERPNLERFFTLADKIFPCIWQIDNSFVLSSDDSISSSFYESVHKAAGLLLTYNLIQPFDIKPVTGKNLFIELDSLIEHYDDWKYPNCAKVAMAYGRKDILKGLGVGDELPVNRKEYWKEFYKNNLGKSGINFWEWKANPEALDICDELTTLLSLPEPIKDVRYVLEVLAEGKHPFYKSSFKPQDFMDLIQNGADVFNEGKYANWNPKIKDAIVKEFKKWHNQVQRKIGKQNLLQVYKVCFSASEELINSILNSPKYTPKDEPRQYKKPEEVFKWWKILEVSPNASLREVKDSYKRLMRKYHPDVNKAPDAKEKAQEINNAYEYWENNTQKQVITEPHYH